MFKRWLLILIQSAVTIGLLAFFFHDPDFRAQVADAIKTADPQWLLIGIGVAGVENLLGVVRWRMFLKMLGIHLPFWRAVQICLVALFCNTFLIGAAGGDLVRAAYLIRCGHSKTDSLLSVVMDRVSGLGALIIYTLGLAFWNYEWLARSPLVVEVFKWVIIYQLVALVFLVLSLFIAVRKLNTLLPKWIPFPEFARRFEAGYAKMAIHWRTSVSATAISMVMLLGLFGVFYCSAHAFAQPISFIHMATLVPVADIISALPISIGGMGVRESIFQLLLGQTANVPTATAVSISMTGYLINNSWGLLGAAALPLFKGILHDARETAQSIRN